MTAPANSAVPSLHRPRVAKPLLLFLFVEVPILLLLYPQFAGNADIARFLTSAGEFLRYLLWPRSPLDTESYRFVIFQLCSRVTALPFYPYLKAVAPWILPGWFFLAVFIRIAGRVRQRRAARGPRPPRSKTKRTPRGGVSGMYRGSALRADRACADLRSACTDPFPADPGVRVQMLADTYGRKQDYIAPWDNKGEILLTSLHPEGDICITLRDNTAFIDAAGVTYPMPPRIPLLLRRDRESGGTSPQIALTWLGGT